MTDIMNSIGDIPYILFNMSSYVKKIATLDYSVFKNGFNYMLKIISGGSSKTTSPDEYVYLMETTMKMALDDFARTFRSIGSEKIMDAAKQLKIKNRYKCCVWNDDTDECVVCNDNSCKKLPMCVDYYREKGPSVSDVSTINNETIHSSMSGGKQRRNKSYNQRKFL